MLPSFKTLNLFFLSAAIIFAHHPLALVLLPLGSLDAINEFSQRRPNTLGERGRRRRSESVSQAGKAKLRQACRVVFIWTSLCLVRIKGVVTRRG
jgi:hypothetical protein